MPRLARACSRAFFVELQSDLIEAEALSAQGLHSVHRDHFALIEPVRLAAPTTPVCARLRFRAPASFRTIMLLSYCAKTPITCRNAVRLSDADSASEAGDVAVIRSASP